MRSSTLTIHRKKLNNVQENVRKFSTSKSVILKLCAEGVSQVCQEIFTN